MPLCAIPVYLKEKYTQKAFEDNCLFMTAAVNIAEDKRYLFEPPYLKYLESRKKPVKVVSEEEALDYIFAGANI